MGERGLELVRGTMILKHTWSDSRTCSHVSKEIRFIAENTNISIAYEFIFAPPNKDGRLNGNQDHDPN